MPSFRRKFPNDPSKSTCAQCVGLSCHSPITETHSTLTTCRTIPQLEVHSRGNHATHRFNVFASLTVLSTLIVAMPMTALLMALLSATLLMAQNSAATECQTAATDCTNSEQEAPGTYTQRTTGDKCLEGACTAYIRCDYLGYEKYFIATCGKQEPLSFTIPTRDTSSSAAASRTNQS